MPSIGMAEPGRPCCGRMGSISEQVCGSGGSGGEERPTMPSNGLATFCCRIRSTAGSARGGGPISRSTTRDPHGRRSGPAAGAAYR